MSERREALDKRNEVLRRDNHHEVRHTEDDGQTEDGEGNRGNAQAGLQPWRVERGRTG